MTFLKNIGISLAVRYFSALLPREQQDHGENDATHDQNYDYYQVMGLNSNATMEDIRKAYKKKSLLYHPDKIAQRGGDPEVAKHEYQKIQEAHAVLCDSKKRGLYDSLGRNTIQYRYISSGTYMNPQAMYENMTTAPFGAKSRLFFIILMLMGLVFLQPILIVVKVNHILEEDGGTLESTNWITLLIPTWLLHGLYVALWFLIFVTTVTSGENKNQLQTFFAFVEQACWLIWEILLALRWDGIVDATYARVFIPLYCAISLKVLQMLYAMIKVRSDVTRMISITNLEQNILEEGRTYEDLTEEERNELQDEFILVHVPADHGVVEEELLAHADEDEIEEARVHSSPEFQQAMAIYANAFEAMFQTLLFWPVFITLLVLKIDDHKSYSFWIVFIPVWIRLGRDVLGGLYACCCQTIPGDEIVLDGVDIGGGSDAAAENDGEEEKETEKLNREVDESMKRIKESTQFAPTEGSMSKEFLKKSDTATAASAAATISEEKASEENKKEKETKESIGSLSKTTSPTIETATKQQADVEMGDDMEEGETFHIDEETYREWQSAYEEAENSAMEESAKALGKGCYGIFQLTIMLLLVAKLEQDYKNNNDGDEENEGDNDVGFNAVWIIFPTLVIAGIILCCCACTIYCAPQKMSVEEDDEQDNTSNSNQQQEKTDDNNNVLAQENSTTVDNLKTSPNNNDVEEIVGDTAAASEPAANDGGDDFAGYDDDLD